MRESLFFSYNMGPLIEQFYLQLIYLHHISSRTHEKP